MTRNHAAAGSVSFSMAGKTRPNEATHMKTLIRSFLAAGLLFGMTAGRAEDTATKPATDAAKKEAKAAKHKAKQAQLKSATAGTAKGYTQSAGEAAAKAEPRFTDPQVELGRLEMQAGQLDAARARLAAALDRESYQPQLWALAIRRLQVMGAPSLPELQGLLTRLDADYAPIAKLNARDGYALAFHMAPYAIAAYRVSLAGLDYQPLLKRAQEELDAVHALGTNMEDAEQHALLVHYVAARAQVAQHKDPAPFLAAMEEDRKRCLAVEPNDAPCMANAVLGEWVEADWKAQNKQPFLPILRRALEHAMAAAQRPEKLVMPWRILAETHLRLARTEETAAARRRGFLIGPPRRKARPARGHRGRRPPGSSTGVARPPGDKLITRR